jgi:hypothetical protein
MPPTRGTPHHREGRPAGLDAARYMIESRARCGHADPPTNPATAPLPPTPVGPAGTCLLLARRHLPVVATALCPPTNHHAPGQAGAGLHAAPYPCRTAVQRRPYKEKVRAGAGPDGDHAPRVVANGTSFSLRDRTVPPVFWLFYGPLSRGLMTGTHLLRRRPSGHVRLRWLSAQPPCPGHLEEPLPSNPGYPVGRSPTWRG